jgi:hypothetical protein
LIRYKGLADVDLDDQVIEVERVRVSAQLSVIDVLASVERTAAGRKAVQYLCLLAFLTPHGAYGIFMKDYAAYRTITLSSRSKTQRWRLTDLVVALTQLPAVMNQIQAMMSCVPALNLYFRGAMK